MKKLHVLLNFLMLCSLLGTISGCRRNGDDVWEDTKTASRHMNRGVRSLAGKHGDSRAVSSREAFYPSSQAFYPSSEGDFIPLGDYQGAHEVAMADFVAPQPRETPGDPGSTIPGIDAFSDPSLNPQLSRVFKNIQFDYNSSSINGQENENTLNQVSFYLRNHPNTYIFVAGHTDERGPESYNLSLGARRSNAVRNDLIASGVSPNNVFTISYGKEQPLSLEHHEEAWSLNRRAEFKVYQR